MNTNQLNKLNTAFELAQLNDVRYIDAIKNLIREVMQEALAEIKPASKEVA